MMIVFWQLLIGSYNYDANPIGVQNDIFFKWIITDQFFLRFVCWTSSPYQPAGVVTINWHTHHDHNTLMGAQKCPLIIEQKQIEDNDFIWNKNKSEIEWNVS